MHIKTNKKLILAGILLACFAIVALPACAESNPNTFSGGIDRVRDVAGTSGLSGGKSAKEILQSITKWLLSLIGTLAVISLLYGGYLYVTSQGEEDKAEQAKNIILYSVIGIIVIGISAIVVNVVINIATQ